MSDKKKIYKPRPVSGFPEWLPEVRRVEQQWFDHIRRIFESYGFCNIETPSVEELDVICAKGGDEGDDVDKEVYVIERLHKDENDKEARLALHFDQTVPLARYTAQHFNELVFPFKRYQMQRVWRGERPQAGRFREFYQCDIDVIAQDDLPLHFDAEMPAIIWEILSTLPGMENEKIQIQISNRKILIGLLHALEITNIVETTRIIDKMDKLPIEQVRHLLQEQIGLDEKQCDTVLKLAQIKTTDTSFVEKIVTLGVEHAMINEGVQELAFVMAQLAHIPEGGVVADLSIVRGLDYYTGTVYETRFVEDPTYGSICSGGRYDDLASNYINKKLPGVGISIGFSRLFDRIKQKQQLPVAGVSPAQVLVVLPAEDKRAEVQTIAKTLRDRGYNVEVFHTPSKLKRQMAYAERKGIPFVWFPPFDEGGNHEVKNMLSGEQVAANASDWTINV